MLVEETLRTCVQYLTASRREESKEHRAETYHSMLLLGKLQTAVRYIMEQDTGECYIRRSYALRPRRG